MAHNSNEMLSAEQAEWLKEVAVAFSDTLFSDLSLNVNSIYTPSLLNQTLINLNNNPQTPTYKSLVEALNNAKFKAKDLRGYQEWMELAEITFKRLIEYYSNILSFDLSYTCINVKDKSEYKTAKYKKDKQKVEDFLVNFNYKKEFLKVVRQVMRAESAILFSKSS